MDTKEDVHPSERLEFATVGPAFDRLPTYLPDTGQQRGNGGPARSVDSFLNLRSSDDLFAGLSHAVPELGHLAGGAKAATRSEHKMTLMESLRLYPKAIGWSTLLSMTIVMEGYDTNLITAFFAFPEFRRSYGHRQPDGRYEISTPWQTALTSGAVVGEILGLFINGLLTERYGYKKTLIGALVWLCFFVFLAFFAFNVQMLLASQVLCGLSWGIFQTLSTTYAAEVMPVALRAYLTSTVNICWLLGQIVSVGVIRAVVHTKSHWSYRIPFGLQWVWAAPIIAGMCFAPESPWWLVRHGRFDDARRSLKRLTSRGVDFNVDETVAMMRHTDEVEKYLGSGTSYWDCFKGSDLRRTEIACVVWMAQTLGGSSLTGYAAYFYVQAGFSPESAFDLAIGMYGVAIISGIIAIMSMRFVGRRTLYLWGLALSLVVLLVAGGIGTRPDSAWVSWTLGSLVIVLTFVYDGTLGPICYALVAEIPSTRLRVKTVVLARVAYNIVGLISNTLMPKMLNPTAWNWKGKTCFLWAGTCFACLIWCYYRLPEPKGLTYMELDILFEKRAKAKKFKEFQVNLASTGYFSINSTNANTANGWRGIAT